MRVHEMRDLAAEDLTAKISDTRKEIVDMRFQLAARKLENPGKLRQARKMLARLLTIQTQKAGGNAPKAEPKAAAKKTAKAK